MIFSYFPQRLVGVSQLLFLGFLAFACVASLSQPVAAQVIDEEEDELRTGLIARYSSQKSDVDFQRLDNTIAFAWGKASPDARLGNKRFAVQWNGYLMSQAQGPYRLYAYASGQVQIKLNGKLVLDAVADQPQWLASKPIELSFDWHEIEVIYQRTGPTSHLVLYWSGPQFQLEPISERQFFHDPDKTPDSAFERGQTLARALRCEACHTSNEKRSDFAAPALDHLSGNLQSKWMVDWLLGQDENLQKAKTTDLDSLARRMPNFDFSQKQAEALSAYLLSFNAKQKRASRNTVEKTIPTKSKPRKPKKGSKKSTQPNSETGEKLFATLGCFACHRAGALGESNLFGGGDLTNIARKRPTDFFERWLIDPAQINSDQRMPVFQLSLQERKDLSEYLKSLGTDPDDKGTVDKSNEEDTASEETSQTPAVLIDQGRQLFSQNRCGQCHRGPETSAEPAKVVTSLSRKSDWQQACSTNSSSVKHKPAFGLSANDHKALRLYFSTADPTHSRLLTGREVLRERNCLACHDRNGAAGLSRMLPKTLKAHEELASLASAMTPPALTSIGDKLTDKALADAIGRTSDGLRPWLLVRMPKFKLSDQELQALTSLLIQTDRIPNDTPHSKLAHNTSLTEATLESAGRRLVTPAGFGCTSCHQIGKVKPTHAPINALGPDLSLLEKRIRRSWFDRWVRNPARITPRMEMPSVQLAVRGVLKDKLEDQLDAVWQVLNIPGFEPPKPDAVRIVRRSGIADRNERTAVLTDVTQVGKTQYIKPLLLGFPNRHNVLFDLQTNRLVQWTIGDTARQRTQGKSWYWEAAGSDLLQPGFTNSELALVLEGQPIFPQVLNQFPTEIDSLHHINNTLVLKHRLHFGNSAGNLVTPVQQTFSPTAVHDNASSGWKRKIIVSNLPKKSAIRWQVLSSARMAESTASKDGRLIVLPGKARTRIRIVSPENVKLNDQGVLTAYASTDGKARVELEYLTDLPVDRFPLVAPQPLPLEAVPLLATPGFEAIRLPLSDEIMPTALAWRPGGELIITSLKGRVWLGKDTDNDSLVDKIHSFSDELAAPFGAAAAENYIDVINKYALLRLFDDDGDGKADRSITLASGWAHTADYHDWAFGLPRDKAGNYYISTACQQDKRSETSAYLRGKVMKLSPRKPTPEDPRLYSVKVISGGHRFPVGIARNRAGDLFVTDNQGNYNPFNELNHVMTGARYGFLNLVERKPGFSPPLTPPAVDIPHPWTRSVNGICFLETPEKVRQASGHNVFGPFEGHLIGCEYDTRRLIRMSLQKVNGIFQGAAYPFSLEITQQWQTFLGPLCCSVSPEGDLYIGGIRDSGWGGSNNIGEIVRLRPQLEKLPAGITEVRAVKDGFVIAFTAKINSELAADIENYSLSSYTRFSTPAYGGEDQDRRIERISSVDVSSDGMRVRLKVQKLRAGYVYEFQLKNLTGKKARFYPSEAHYTMRSVPN